MSPEPGEHWRGRSPSGRVLERLVVSVHEQGDGTDMIEYDGAGDGLTSSNGWRLWVWRNNAVFVGTLAPEQAVKQREMDSRSVSFHGKRS